MVTVWACVEKPEQLGLRSKEKSVDITLIDLQKFTNQLGLLHLNQIKKS